MKAAETWKLIHEERSATVEMLRDLSDEQWASPSWCGGWTVHQTAGHILAAAEQTPMNFFKQMARARFEFDVFADRDAKLLGELPPAQLVERLGDRTATTNHPPAPIVAMLGEIVVHSADIRRPLGIEHRSSDEALVAVAENYRRTNLLIGSKRRIEGLALSASDVSWDVGSGPEVTGPLSSLILVMSGRAQAAGDLSGEGLETLVSRC
jgi:uncharacterized protein (TIGR03083 family)